MGIKQTARLIYNDLINYKIKYGLIKGIFKYLVDLFEGKFDGERNEEIKKI